jgi:O-acetyl-ADP-ribose deacetylase (regulator of RNase III)
MKIILVDPKQALCRAWQEEFQNLPNIEIVQGNFEQLPKFDCMVSSANSFGMMDVQSLILRDYLGEQPVGTSIIVETGHPDHPFLAHTPTMRVPMPIAHTDHVYSAMWAMLLAVHHHNQTANQKINIVACPGFGTSTGKMSYAEAALQMAMAYKNFLNPPTHLDWVVITQRNKPFKPYQIAVEYQIALRSSQENTED